MLYTAPGTEQRCQAIITSRLNPERIGERCKNWKMPGGGDYCAVHRDWGDRRCTGTYSKGHESNGGRCVQVAMVGQPVCEKHGGLIKKPLLVAEAKEAKIRSKMVAIVEKFSEEDSPARQINNPLEALKSLSGELFAHKELMRAYVSNLDGQIRYESKAGGEQLRAEMALYERAMDRCVNLLAAIAKLNIDERLAKIEEAKVILIITAVATAMNRANITNDQAVIVRRELAAELRTATE
jgi:hypothetical protein